MSSESTYGSRYRALATAHERLALDEAEGRRAAFAEVDALLDRLVLAALRGNRVVDKDGTLAVAGPQRPVLTEWFSVEHGSCTATPSNAHSPRVDPGAQWRPPEPPTE